MLNYKKTSISRVKQFEKKDDITGVSGNNFDGLKLIFSKNFVLVKRTIVS